MHETGMVRDVMRAAEEAAGGARVTALRLRVGPLSGLVPAAVAAACRHYAAEAWGSVPSVVVDAPTDPGEDGSGSIRLVSISVAD